MSNTQTSVAHTRKVKWNFISPQRLISCLAVYIIRTLTGTSTGNVKLVNLLITAKGAVGIRGIQRCAVRGGSVCIVC